MCVCIAAQLFLAQKNFVSIRLFDLECLISQLRATIRPHPVQLSIRGNLKIVQLPANGDKVELLEYLNNRKAEIQSIVDVQTNAIPIKLGLRAGIQMIKDIHSDGEGDGEETKILGKLSNEISLPGEWTT